MLAETFRRAGGLVIHGAVRVACIVGVTLVTACSSSSSGGSTGPATYPATDSNTMCQATITQGGLVGKATGSTCQYLGIPYAAPPVGPLRFMPPVAASGWTAPRDATAFGPSCLQATSALGATGATSEDCLSVNVYTPKAAPAQPLPVMVFIYGGAFTSGSSSLYNGQAMSEKGPVVVVSMNYRLGAFGFLALPQLDAQRSGAPSGSDGIRDQQLALQWVQKNIATFHGDPTNVTVFGESAGSISTCIHIVSPGSQGLANRYIMESGACVGNGPLLQTKAQAYQISQELAASVCSTGSSAGTPDGGTSEEAGASGTGSDAEAAPAPDAGATDLVTCLQNANSTQIVNWLPPAGAPATGLNLLLGNLLGAPFAPTIEGTGGVLPDTPANILASGNFNSNADILAGTNENEFGLFVDLATSTALGGSATSPLNVTTTAQLNQGIVQVFGQTAAAMVEQQYPSTDATASQVFVDLVTDYAFRCPTRDLAKAILAKSTKNYFLYSYNIGPAWHSFELVPLFDVSALGFLGATVPSATYTGEMLGYWTQFAATGNPNAASGATSPAWPMYTTTDEDYLTLLDPTPMANSKLKTTQCEFWDSFTGTPGAN